jgi:hypothetical protein
MGWGVQYARPRSLGENPWRRLELWPWGNAKKKKNAMQRKGNRTRFTDVLRSEPIISALDVINREIMIADLPLPCQRPGGWVPNYVPVITTSELDPPNGCLRMDSAPS